MKNREEKEIIAVILAKVPEDKMLMNETGMNLFREENLKKASEPERLDAYLKVTGFGPWLVLLAAALALAAVFVWAFFGRLHITVTGAGNCENGTLVCYVAQKDIDDITENSVADVEGAEGAVTGIDADLFAASEVPKDVLPRLTDSKWYCRVTVNCPQEDGLYTVIFQKPVAPASFMTRGD